MKSLYNFYLDDEDKVQVINKLSQVCGDSTKGQLAAYLRVCVKQLIYTPVDKVKPELIDAIQKEYEYCQKLNKRSKM